MILAWAGDLVALKFSCSMGLWGSLTLYASRRWMIFVMLDLNEDQYFARIKSHPSTIRQKLNWFIYCLDSTAIIMEA